VCSSDLAGYGTQFHFEANRNVVADWTRRFPDVIAGMDGEWAHSHSAQVAAHGAGADAAGLVLARAWVGLI
jgi:GMP synthase (glutamine-hydrolysing)